MSEQLLKKKNIRKFMLIWLFITVVIFFRDFENRVLPYNSTILAFSYKYGFISRGLAGTIYSFIDSVTSADMMCYEAVLEYCTVLTVISYVVLGLFLYLSLKKCKCELQTDTQYIMIFFTIFAVSMFAYKRNLGRLDIYLFVISLVCALCLIYEKFQWVIIPCSALGVMFHQGYIFMYFHILLVLLIYKILSDIERNQKKYYIAIASASIIAVLALFTWFEFFSHNNGEMYIDEIIQNAISLTRPFKGMKYHDTLIQAEILGVDLSEIERPLHIMNFIELPVFLVITSPYSVIVAKLFSRVIKASEKKQDKIKYVIVSIGSLTLLPLFIFKVDYGRWIFALITYYCVIIISLLAMNDKLIEMELSSLFSEIRSKKIYAILLILLPVLLTPLWDVHIDGLMRGFSNPINKAFLHIW